MFVQHWKWRQAKKIGEVWFVFWWMRMLEHAKFIVECLLWMGNTVSPWKWFASFVESLLLLVHICQGHAVFGIHSRYAATNFACFSILSHQETNHTSLLFLACLHFQLWMNILYTTLTSTAIKKQLCGPLHFYYACLLPYRWQNWYVSTVLPAFARNVFYDGYWVIIWLPHKIYRP